jgi:hypothetical protein
MGLGGGQHSLIIAERKTSTGYFEIITLVLVRQDWRGTQVCFAGMPALSISMLNGHYPKFIARRDLGIIPS